MENNKELQRTKSFVFKGETYQIEFPTVGEYLEIENQKLINSDGHWTDLIKSQTISALRSIQIIECVSILKVLCSKIFENMKVVSYKEIDAVDFLELLSIYNTEISPWYSNWFNYFNKIIIEANEKLKNN